MRNTPTNRKRNSIQRNLYAFGTFLTLFCGCLSGQTLLIKGESAPFTLSVLGADNQFVENVDSFKVLGKTRIAIRKKDDIGFQLYNNRLNLLGNAKVTAAKHQMSDIIPFSIGDKWGIADSNGTLKIKPKFDEVIWVKGDKIGVRIKNEYAIVAKNGKWIVKPGMPKQQFESDAERNIPTNATKFASQFDKVFWEDTASIIRVLKSNLYGYLNVKNGSLVAAPQFLDAAPFSGSKAVVRTSRGFNLMNKEGTVCALQYFDSIIPSRNKNLVFCTGKGDDRWMGLITDKCEIIVPGTYKSIEQFVGEIAVCSKNGNGKNYLTNEGDEVFPKMSFEQAEPLVGNFGIVKFNDAYHVLDIKSANPKALFLAGNRNSFQLIHLE